MHPDALRAHVRALKANGWKFATVSQLESFRDRPKELPRRVVVLTFDDGLESFYRVVLPMLREEQVPATLTVVPSFLDAPPPDLPPVLSWDQLTEIAQSGWVEIASHTNEQHVLTAGNPFGTPTAAVTTRKFLTEDERYEDRAEYRTRIAADLAASKQTLEQRLGVPVRSLAWPYGEHNAVARELAEQAGFALTMGLNGGPASVQDLEEGFVERLLVTRGVDIGDADLTRWLVPDPDPVFAANVDLDELYDEDPEKLVANVESTIRQLWRLGATHVFLKGCSDPKGIGYLESTYFMNHQAPVRADVWGMVAGRMKRAGLRVWMRAPALNLSWEWERHPEWRVRSGGDAGTQLTAARYFRLSPDSEAARRAAMDFFNDVAVYAPLDGILFDEDAF
ncbi:MAG: poly-beta-1,6-N-acetyl-D-glucosamine N-deacetylase PgaB, partial [Candidatus Rokuibacteriota bacterium]